MNPQDFWNGRYRQKSYAYGTLPNEFIAQSLEGLTPGKIYLPAEGEGRNAVFAATKGWEVWAADQSEEGKKKAIQLAEHHNVEIHYHVGNAMVYTCPAPLDAVGFCYFHTPEAILAPMYSHILGQLNLEALSYSKGSLRRIWALKAVDHKTLACSLQRQRSNPYSQVFKTLRFGKNVYSSMKASTTKGRHGSSEPSQKNNSIPFILTTFAAENRGRPSFQW